MKKKIERLVSSKQLKIFTLEQAAMRQNSLNILAMPSRMANTLYYPNGMVKKDR